MIARKIGVNDMMHKNSERKGETCSRKIGGHGCYPGQVPRAQVVGVVASLIGSSDGRDDVLLSGVVGDRGACDRHIGEGATDVRVGFGRHVAEIRGFLGDNCDVRLLRDMLELKYSRDTGGSHCGRVVEDQLKEEPQRRDGHESRLCRHRVAFR